MIVEDGTIVADADSLASVDFADAYHEARGNAAWAALDDFAREAALVRATDFIEGAYRLRWAGSRTSPSTQSLSWPRTGVYVAEEGYYVAENHIPHAVRRAVAELAGKAAAGTELSPDLGKEVVREKVDVIEVEYAAGSRQQPHFVAVERLLEPYLKTPSSTGVLKLSRA